MQEHTITKGEDMMENASYDKVKLLHQLSELVWFIDKHALKDLQEAGDNCCLNTLKEVHTELEQQVKALQKTLQCCKECE